VIDPDLNNMFELNKDMVEQALESKFVLGATAFLHPSYPSVFLDFVENKINVSVIMTENAIEKLKTDYRAELKMFLDSSKGKLYVYPDNMELASLFITEMFMMICLFDSKGRYDRKDLVFCNADAVHWGQELFEYYLLRSDQITEV
jgi:predicted transcriptional regulator